MRIIAGDGILAADPLRIVILDAENRLIARGPRVRFLTLVCDAPLRCYGYDHGSGEVIAPDPGTFGKDGPVVHPANDEDNLWEIESGDAVWGVTIRPATWRQWLSAETGLLARTPPMHLVTFAALGLVAGLCTIGLRPLRSVPPSRVLFWLAALLFRLFGFGLVLLVLTVPVFLGDAAPLVVFGPALAAALIVWSLWLAFRARARTRAAARRGSV